MARCIISKTVRCSFRNKISRRPQGLLVILWLTVLLNKAYTLEYTHNYTISNGLAHNGVTCILEDSRGYYWIGTYDGLNRYDGYEFKTLKNSIDEEKLAGNRIRSVVEDKRNGNLLIGTDEGLSFYNDQTNQSEIIYTHDVAGTDVKGPIIRNIVISEKEQKIYCVTQDVGILIFDFNYNLSKKFIIADSGTNKLFELYDLLELDSINALVITSNDLRRVNLRSGKSEVILYNHTTQQGNSLIWLGNDIIMVTKSSGVEVIKVNKVNNDYSFISLGLRLPQFQFNCAATDKIDNLWLGTREDGIIRVKNIDLFIKNSNYQLSRYTTPTDLLRVSSFYAGNSNSCWTGTFNRGIYRFNLINNPFHRYNTSMNLKNGLYSNLVTFSSAIDKNKCYIVASRGGLSLYNTLTNKFEPLPFNMPDDSELNIGFVLVDSDKNLWFNINTQGIYLVKKGNRTPINISVKYPALTYLNTNTIIEDTDRNIWIGGSNIFCKLILDEDRALINYQDVFENPFFETRDNPLVRCIYEDPLYNYIWVGTDVGGLFRITIDSNTSVLNYKIEQYVHNRNDQHSISSNFVSDIVRLPNGQLWIGTERGGICKVINSNTEPKFVYYTEKNGLSNNVVKSLWYDDEYNLWIATNIGLNKFDTKTNVFRTFTKEEGLPFEEFWYHNTKLDNGQVLLSGLDGFCYFNPKELPDYEPLPHFELSELQIFNQSVYPGDTLNDRILLTQSIDQTKELVLKHNENVISFKITSLHFANPKNRYLRYQLYPLNTNWTEVSSDQRLVKYQGLQPGEYTFRVMVSNSLNEWTEPKELRINIVPPFWKTYKAYILYVFSLALLGYIIMYVVLRIQKLKHKLHIEQLELDKVHEVNEAKLRFFSNISHEIKTPLTLISGPVNILARRFMGNPSVSEKLQIVQRQSKKIQQLVQQVHDFQKANANALQMNASRFCFNTFVNEIVNDFTFLATNEKKTLRVINNDESIYVLADKDKIEKIFNNLLSNAFKYTALGDSIIVEYKRKKKNLIVKVIDTGTGIIPEDLPHIFERFYQSTKPEKEYVGGSGIGLAFAKRLVEMHYGFISATSKPGNGTTFKVRLPIIITKNGMTQDEVEENILTVEKENKAEQNWIRTNDISNISLSDEVKNARIFLAEDNTEMRLFITDVLSKYFTVQSFPTGKDCLKAMLEVWPDLIISDILMPEMNGFELCKQVKSDIKTSHIPVILLTACTTTDDQIQGIRDGADAYIHKPFNFDHLITRIEALLKGRNALKKRFQTNFPLTLEKINDSGKDVAFLEKLYSLIEDNLDNQELDMDSFAKELYLNRTDFYRKVKALTNQTPYELLRSYRLQKAAEFLGNKQMSISEVASMTGYKSRAHFSNSFKERYKVSPGKYVSEVLKELNS